MIALIMLAAAGSSPGAAKAPRVAVAAPPDWRATASRDDLRRLRTWRDAFVDALAQVRAGGNEGQITREGALLEPDAALDGPMLPTGSYRCRTLKLGAGGDATLSFVSYPSFDCQVSARGKMMLFEKLTGSQRPYGRLYPGGARRQVFLGTLVLGDETRPLGYGRDPSRDIVGAVERIGPQRWRLVMPYPRFESTLDVMELVPAS